MVKRRADGLYPYRPPNGLTGIVFMERFCFRCKRDEKFQRTQDGEDGCSIVLATMIHDVGDIEYPAEWISDDAVGLENPRCTAFEVIDG